MSDPVVDRQAGFTLVELLVAVMIEALIVGALGMAFVGILRGTTQVNQSLSQSGDARNVASYLVSDAGNSSGPETVLNQPTLCGSGTSPAPGSIPFRFTWSSTSSTGTPPTAVANIVDYVKVPTVPATVPVSYTLVRRQCQNGVLVSAHTLAQNVLSVVPACSPSADCSGDPTSITVAITETAASSGAGYTYSLTGAFEKLIGGGDPGPAKAVILLGSSGPCTGSPAINLSGSGAMRIYGEADLNTSDSSSCHAMTMSGSGSYQAGSTTFYGSGTCQKSGSASCPTNVSSRSTLTTDPYAGLGVPSTSGTGTQCVGGVAHPGVFTSQLSISGAGSCQLASGVYILPFGFSVSGSATITSAPGGVLLYITGGGFTISGSQNLNLSALTTGPYVGWPLVWEPASNPNPSFSFSGSGSLQLNGVVYGPKTQVQLSGSGATPIVTSLVVKSITLSGSGTIDVGAPSAVPLAIGPTPTVLWPANTAYSAALSSTGGDGSNIWAATGLPAGLLMNADTGVISGTTPSTAVSKTVTVTLNDALGDDPDLNTFTFTVDPLPVISAASPSHGQGAVGQDVIITGTGFVDGAPLAASFSGTGITVNSTTYNSATSITANVSITSTATTGLRDVLVTNGDTGTATGTGKFTVNAKPAVTAVSVTSRGQGASNQSITITGTGFVSGLTASFSATGITVNSTTYVSPTSATANFSIATNATTGLGDVSVTNPDGGVGTGTGKFTVNAGPVVTSATPSSRPVGITNQNITIAGSNFVSGATVSFSASGVSATTTFVNSTQLTAKTTITAGAATGLGNVIVTNPDAGVGVGAGVFSADALPVVTATSPNVRVQGNTALPITITGSNFISGAVPTVSGTGVTFSSVVFVNSTQLTALVTVTAVATAGLRNVIVTNPDTGVGTGTGLFTVDALPTISSVSPVSHARSATGIVVTINGSGFVSGSVVSFSGSNLPTITASSYVNAGQLTVTLTIPNSANTWNVIVTNPDGGTVTKTGGFKST